MKSERREWHCGLFFAGLILTIPALFSLLPASASSGWGISHIHAALLGGTTALLTAALASAYGREICLQKDLPGSLMVFYQAAWLFLR